jgi:hypothetical protein
MLRSGLKNPFALLRDLCVKSFFPKQKGGEVPARPLLVFKAVSSDNRDREKQAAKRECADEAGQFLHVRSFHFAAQPIKAGSSR